MPAVALGALSLPPQDVARSVRAIGEFSDMRYTAEPSCGYAVQLWREGDSLKECFLRNGFAGYERDGIYCPAVAITEGRRAK